MNTQFTAQVYDIVCNVLIPVGYLVAMYFIHTHLKSHNPKIDQLVSAIEKLVENAAESDGPTKTDNTTTPSRGINNGVD